jgi:hypothetical protein
MRANGAVAEVFFFNGSAGGRVAGAAGALAAGTSEHWQGRQVLYAGESLHGESISADTNFTITGYLFTDP